MHVVASFTIFVLDQARNWPLSKLSLIAERGQEGITYTGIRGAAGYNIALAQLASGDEVQLGASLEDSRDGTRIKWSSTLQLE